MDLNALTQKEAAQLLGLSSRQVSNLVEKGMPRDTSGEGYPTYRWDEVQRWYVSYKEELARAEVETTDLQELEIREKAAKVRIAEMEAAQTEGSLVARASVERAWRDTLERLRARIIAYKGKLAPELTGMRTPQDVLEVLDPAFTELLEVLRTDDEEDVADAA